jgi:hypothetical protein
MYNVGLRQNDLSRAGTKDRAVSIFFRSKTGKAQLIITHTGPAARFVFIDVDRVPVLPPSEGLSDGL